MLATQNPVDLDYKGLSNAGTWFLGRLQTERDKARVLDGLEGALAGQGGASIAREMERMLSALQKRVFFMNNVHDDAPVVFQTRWAMSYLRGPLTREQIRRCCAGAAVAAGLAPPTGDSPGGAAAGRSRRSSGAASAPPGRPRQPPPPAPPVLPPQVEQFFAPASARRRRRSTTSRCSMPRRACGSSIQARRRHRA